jgi:transcriptional regulator with XRE-family HTH domain
LEVGPETLLADVLEISRQQVSAWENGIKPISENRLRQLSKYFGLEEKYFLGISEEDKAFLISKGLYRRQDCDKEVYCFLKQGEVEDDSKYRSFSYPDFDESLDEQMTKAKKKKQGTLQKVEEAIGYFGIPTKIIDEVCSINRGCMIYDILTEYLKQMPNETIPMRMIYFDMVKNVLNSLLLANGLKTKEEIEEEFAFVMSCTMMLIGFMNSPDYLKINMRKKEI